MSLEMVAAIVLVPAVLAVAYYFVFRDFNRLDDRDKGDFGNPG